MFEEQRLSRSVNSQSNVKSGPSVFYILAVTWNPHPALNFPVKYTTFHVTHTNPAAIFLSLNRAESLSEFPCRVRCSCSWDSSHWLAGPKRRSHRVVFESSPEPCLAPASSTLLYSTRSLTFYFKQGFIWLYCTLLDCQGGLKQPPGLQHQPANTSHTKHRAHTHTQHIHRHFHTNRVS